MRDGWGITIRDGSNDGGSHNSTLQVGSVRSERDQEVRALAAKLEATLASCNKSVAEAERMIEAKETMMSKWKEEAQSVSLDGKQAGRVGEIFVVHMYARKTCMCVWGSFLPSKLPPHYSDCRQAGAVTGGAQAPVVRAADGGFRSEGAGRKLRMQPENIRFITICFSTGCPKEVNPRP